MTLTTANGQLNPNNETWAGSIQINNKKSAGVKKNQMYQIKFDPNWEAYMVNIPFDSTISGNKISEVQYKTNLNDAFRTFDGALIKNNNQMYRLDAKAVGLEEGEYFTEVKANVGDFAPGYQSTEASATYRWNSTASYGKIKPGVTSVNMKAQYGTRMMSPIRKYLAYQPIKFQVQKVHVAMVQQLSIIKLVQR
ncbi:hypothetical protein GCM10027614_85010 [Micromonospora vulcania]